MGSVRVVPSPQYPWASFPRGGTIGTIGATQNASVPRTKFVVSISPRMVQW